uniref:Uncharacterized protein n=1 Tax=Eutreptiella gymnastica TaxID=73025 RepID=A0A7S4GBF2_9EUGL|mmetsp:Transcript_81217/g.135854  ORF Transcript_81217/g.135854 Transcript_81217/m.135854 type:complete len:232 (-) Transcript_81217:58-753(-)
MGVISGVVTLGWCCTVCARCGAVLKFPGILRGEEALSKPLRQEYVEASNCMGNPALAGKVCHRATQFLGLPITGCDGRSSLAQMTQTYQHDTGILRSHVGGPKCGTHNLANQFYKGSLHQASKNSCWTALSKRVSLAGAPLRRDGISFSHVLSGDPVRGEGRGAVGLDLLGTPSLVGWAPCACCAKWYGGPHGHLFLLHLGSSGTVRECNRLSLMPLPWGKLADSTLLRGV